MSAPDQSRGLTSDEARARLSRDGPNALPEAERKNALRIVVDVLREPMLALLLAGGTIYLVLGELQDALILVAFALFSIVITIVQEARTERVLRSLRDLSSPQALVMRDGVMQRIISTQLVVGDVIMLQEGDRVPADIVITEAAEMQADESLLTGESVPVTKRAHGQGDPEHERPGGDNLPFAYSGTLIARGEGTGEVQATGPRSEIGRIGQSLAKLGTSSPRLQRETRRLTAALGIFGALVSVLVVLLYGALRAHWLDAALAGIAVGMSMLPEEFPVVLTVFMAMGAWRISQANVLTRRASAVEALGSATVLCTDKTGTLTENRMVITEIRLANGDTHQPAGAANLPALFDEVVRVGVLASAAEPFDPMEKAFHDLSSQASSGWHLARGYGLRPDLLAVTQAWENGGDNGYFVATKGAPEAIASLCHLQQDQVAALQHDVEQMAGSGLRVLGVAAAHHDGDVWPASPHDFDFHLVGLVGLSDPLRRSVPDAVAKSRSAGVRVVMITGDHPRTAQAIARAAGLAGDTILTGADLAAMGDAQLSDAVRSTAVFARILPEQKLRIVEALKRNGEVVAMTGDGVNDAPSLKAADIGIAMGGRGTDVAREAASLVLLDDDFGSIVEAIRLGRRIYDNLRKAMSFIIAVHVPVAGLAVIPLLTGLPILLWPVHIAVLEMIIDPVCSLAFEAEAEEADIMKRPPRPPNTPLLSGPMLLWSAAQGVTVLALALGLYVGGHLSGMPDSELRALVYFVLVAGIVALILVNRSTSASLLEAVRRPNRTLAFIFAAILAILAASLFWPFATELFGFGPLHLPDVAIVCGVGLSVLGLLEGVKGWWRR